MLNKKEAVALTILGVAQSHRKPYCFPSQEKILELTKRIYGVQMSRRTLNRVLRFLVDERMLERTRRHRRGNFNQVIFCSTLYKFRGKLFNWLYLLAKKVRQLFSFYRVPKWAQYKPKRSFMYASPASTPLVVKDLNALFGVHHH